MKYSEGSMMVLNQIIKKVLFIIVFLELLACLTGFNQNLKTSFATQHFTAIVLYDCACDKVIQVSCK